MATKKGHPYSPEFKASVVKMVLEEGQSQEQVRMGMGLASSTISTWVQNAKVGKLPDGPMSLKKNEQQELLQLRKENHVLKMEREILKKATALSQAIRVRQPTSDLLHHSDRGCQYTSEEVQNALESSAYHLQDEPNRKLLR